MKYLFKVSTIILLLVAAIGALLLLGAGSLVYLGTGASLNFINNSGSVVKSANISVAGKSCTIRQLEIAGKATCHFKKLHDSSYSVTVVLENGDVYVEPSLGYVTSGLKFDDTITINSERAIELFPTPNT